MIDMALTGRERWAVIIAPCRIENLPKLQFKAQSYPVRAPAGYRGERRPARPPLIKMRTGIFLPFHRRIW